jgi:hypothetical protein
MRTESLNDENTRPDTLPKIKQAAISELIKENKNTEILEVVNIVKGFMIEKNFPYNSVTAREGDILVQLYGTCYYFNHSREFKNHIM